MEDTAQEFHDFKGNKEFRNGLKISVDFADFLPIYCFHQCFQVIPYVMPGICGRFQLPVGRVPLELVVAFWSTHRAPNHSPTSPLG